MIAFTLFGTFARIEHASRCLDNRSMLLGVERDSGERLKKVLGKPFSGFFGLLEPRLRRDFVEDFLESAEFIRLKNSLGQIPLHGPIPYSMPGPNFVQKGKSFKGAFGIATKPTGASIGRAALEERDDG